MNSRSPMPLCSRRQFLTHCAACAGCVTGEMLLRPRASRASVAASEKPRIRLVFCETANDKPIWPNIGYDFSARRKQVIELLATGCPDVQFLPVQVMDHPKQADDVLATDAEVDGYLVSVQGLGWSNDIFKLCTTGKPTLLVDNLFGGSGLFLTRLPQIMNAGKPVDWVSSLNDQDIVASARNFVLLSQGKSAAEVAAAFRSARRENTPTGVDPICQADEIAVPNFDAALERLKNFKILVVGDGWGGDGFRTAAKQVVGIGFIPISFDQLSQSYAQADQDLARRFADQWTNGAERVVEPDRREIDKSAAMYVAMKQLMAKHDARGISINCLGGFYGGHLKAYPCLGFSQLNDDGLVGGCEADQMSALTMATIGALVGRASFISDPVIDTSTRQIIYAHCVAMTKPFGPEGSAHAYRIRSHSEDRKGASMQVLLPEGYMTTTLEINPVSRQVLMHQAITAGNNDSDMACRTKLAAVVQGDLEKLAEHWAMGWHRVTFYGDLREHVNELCARLGLRLIQEA